jgi:hypothetical protein
MANITAASKSIKIIFDKDPAFIKEITNLSTGEKFCSKGRQTIIVRSPSHISDPVYLFDVESFFKNNGNIFIMFQDDTGSYKARLNISESSEGFKFRMETDSPEIIWMVEWCISGFKFEQVTLPALGGQTLTKEMTPDLTLSYKFPFWWNAQFLLGENKKGGMFLYTRDEKPGFKLVRVKREEDTFLLHLGFEADAPLKEKSLSAEWFIESYSGDWRNPVDKHRSWLERKHKLHTYSSHPHMPEWANNINFILAPWGMRKDQPEPHHTFDEIVKRVKDFSKLHDPEQTLLYLPGFAENGIDSHAPDYNPSIKCGGEGKFRELINAAHKIGYRVMIHTNAIALTFNHPLYERFKDYQVVDWSGKKIGWGMDIDGDWLPEDYFAYVNPGFNEWGSYMEEVIGRLIAKFKIDAVFLDQTLLAFNVSNGPNFIDGMRNHVNHLQSVFPDTLFAGEGIHEEVLRVMPFAQIHGIDSLSEIHGMEGNKRWRKVHPVSSFLFGKYTRLCGHLLTKYPKHPKFKLQEDAYSNLGVIPALSLYNSKQKMNIPEVKKMIRRAKQLIKH